MTSKEYLAQNAKGFEGDWILEQTVRKLVSRKDIRGIVETGTYLGATTLKFAEMCDDVHTIEINPEYYYAANKVFNLNENIHSVLGNTVNILPSVCEYMIRGFGDSVLFWLDAHWHTYCPLLEELSIIAAIGMKPVIAIHDFVVPNHPELGYDSYNGQPFNWEWIAKHIEAIYGAGGFTVSYNTQAEGAKRGVIFIEPK